MEKPCNGTFNDNVDQELATLLADHAADPLVENLPFHVQRVEEPLALHISAADLQAAVAAGDEQ